MREGVKRAWQKELRDPANKQAHNTLIDVGPDGTERMCCLGLLQRKVLGLKLAQEPDSCNAGVRGINKEGERYVETAAMTPGSIKRTGMAEWEIDRAINANDSEHLTFPEIAELIEDW
jgi:hypothetical protein